MAAVDDSLARLRTDHVDLDHAHYDEDVAIEDQVATFAEVVESGKARAIGLSNFSPERMREWFEMAYRRGLSVPAAIQPGDNLVSREGF